MSESITNATVGPQAIVFLCLCDRWAQ